MRKFPRRRQSSDGIYERIEWFKNPHHSDLWELAIGSLSGAFGLLFLGIYLFIFLPWTFLLLTLGIIPCFVLVLILAIESLHSLNDSPSAVGATASKLQFRYINGKVDIFLWTEIKHIKVFDSIIDLLGKRKCVLELVDTTNTKWSFYNDSMPSREFAEFILNSFKKNRMGGKHKDI